MVPYFGDFAVNSTVYIPINTFDSNDPAASVTVTNLLNTDVHIHKDGGTTQRNNAAGITMTVDYDSITGNHLLIIDTSDNTVADFFQAGHEYQVRIEGATVDAGTINAWVGCFSIERAGGALANSKELLTRIPDATAGQNGGLVICGSNAATTFATLTVTTNAIAWNAAWDAEVESEVNDALVVLRLDHLILQADSDDVANNSIIAKLASKSATADWSSFNNTTDSLEAIKDAGAGGGATAQQVWEYTDRQLTLQPRKI